MTSMVHLTLQTDKKGQFLTAKLNLGRREELPFELQKAIHLLPTATGADRGFRASLLLKRAEDLVCLF